MQAPGGNRVTNTRFAELVLARMAALARALAAARWPDFSAFWLSLYSTFMHAGVRQLVARIGRRGGKSSFACYFAVAFALVYATLGLVPPGDVGWVVFVSVSREEADQRLKTIAKILSTIGVSFTPEGQTILIDGTNIGFRVQACTVASVSGWTSILIVADEVSRWLNREDGTNPASLVLGALRPTMATQPFARILLLSSPLGTLDAHAQAFDEGPNGFQLVAHAPTWVANPTLTEEACRQLEPHPSTFAREYGALAQLGASLALDREHVEAMVRPPHPDARGLSAGAEFTDPSGGQGNEWTFANAQYVIEPSLESQYETRPVFDGAGRLVMRDAIIYDCEGRPVPNPRYRPPRRVLYVSDIGAFEGVFAQTVTFDDVIETIARLALGSGVRDVYGDQFLAFSCRSAYARFGLRYIEKPWTAPAKIESTGVLRRLLRDRLVCVEPGPEAEKLKLELLSLQERITPNGVTIEAPRRAGSGHADRASLLLLMAHVESSGELAGSPIARSNTPSTYDPYTNEVTYG